MKLSDLAKRMMKLSPSKWEATIDKLSPADRRGLRDELDELAVWATILGGYAEGTTISNHEDAVHGCMLRRRRVRKALGYSYPLRGSFTF